ncbi:glycan-binding surface protein [Niabella sp. W65]|nr:glycan-binding surface protein [Niabella sp. W65]MCH7364779.1 glycan-binding surface protein [Niabella sp. W65]
MQSGDGTAGDGKYNFPIGENQWVPVANLSDPVDSWAIQFDISVARPWNGGTLCFANAFAGNYVARYEPWQVAASRTAPSQPGDGQRLPCL